MKIATLVIGAALSWIAGAGPPTIEVPSRARLDNPLPLPTAPPPGCKLTANPAVVGVDDSYTDYGMSGRTFVVTGQGVPTTLCLNTGKNPGLVFSAEISGPGMPTKSVALGGGCVSSGYGPYGAAAYTYSGATTGPGGNNTCTTTVQTTCASSTSFLEGIWAVPYATFNWGGDTFVAINDPPFCTWDWVGHGNRGANPGCFAGETRLRTGPATWKRADAIREGDSLWNPVTRVAATVRKVIYGPERAPFVEVAVGGRRVRVTTKHPMVTKRGILAAEKMRADDELRTEDGAFHRVSSLTRVASEFPPMVYNFELDIDDKTSRRHLLDAEGVVTGDYYLQYESEMREARR